MPPPITKAIKTTKTTNTHKIIIKTTGTPFFFGGTGAVCGAVGAASVGIGGVGSVCGAAASGTVSAVVGVAGFSFVSISSV